MLKDNSVLLEYCIKALEFPSDQEEITSKTGREYCVIGEKASRPIGNIIDEPHVNIISKNYHQ